MRRRRGAVRGGRPPGTRRERRGFSLVEMLVALVVGSALAGMAAWLAAQALAVERREGERAGLTASLRTGLAYLAYELEVLGADSISGSDLDSTAAGVAFRAQRGLRVACRIVPDTVVVTADTALDWSTRGPVPGRDSMLLYAAGDSATLVDAWDPLPIYSLRQAVCPGGGAALAVATAFDSGAIARRRHTGRTAVRLFESVAVRGYPGAGGGWQLGRQSLSGGGAIQPLAGALQQAGFQVRAADRAGRPVPVGSAAWTLGLLLRGQPDRQLAAGLAARSGTALDSVRGTILLRNHR